MLQPQGSLNIGSIVEAECEPGDGEFVEATIKAIDVGTGQLTLQFANSLVRSNVAFSEIRMSLAGLGAPGRKGAGAGEPQPQRRLRDETTLHSD
jgi:hypothetical protein